MLTFERMTFGNVDFGQVHEIDDRVRLLHAAVRSPPAEREKERGRVRAIHRDRETERVR